MDKLVALSVFQRVAETESFSRAADSLKLSKSAVSKHVSALEDSLGVRLLYRTTRRVSLTEAGRAYLDRTRRILEDMEEADNAVSALATEIKGQLKINAPLSFGTRHLGPALAELACRHPALITEIDLIDRFVDVVEEGYDLVIRIGELADSTLIARKLAEARFAICAAPHYLDRAGTPAVPEDLVGHACLRYRQARLFGNWPFEGPGGEIKVPVSGPLVANNGDLLAEAAAAGLGVALLPTFIVGDQLRDGTLIRVLEDWTPPALGIWAIYPPNRHLSAKVRVVIDHLARTFGPAPYWDEGC